MDNDLRSPYFSVIMPAYNAADFLSEAVRSVLNQRFGEWELIIVNDGSTDETETIARTFAEADLRIRLISQMNLGLNEARKTGMRAAKGCWAAFLDADDTWLEGKLSRQYALLEHQPSVDVVFTDGYTLPYDTPVRLPYHFPVATGFFTGETMYCKLFESNCIPVLSACIRSSFLPYLLNDQYKETGSEDWNYWLTLAEVGATFYGLSDRLFVYRLRPGSMSAMTFDQRLSTALVLMRHFNKDRLSSAIIKAYKRTIGDVYRILFENGRKQQLELLVNTYAHFHPGEKFEPGLARFDGSSIKEGLTQMLKRSVLKLVQWLFFRPYRAWLKHGHNVRIQYIRWKMGISLETRGKFFVARFGDIYLTDPDARLSTHGLYLGEYSRINLAGKSRVYTGSETRINNYCNFNIWNGELLIGNNVFFNNYCSVNCMQDIRIGDNTWFGEGVRMYDHNHAYREPSKLITEQGMRTGKISIGANCWIGSNTVILQNVTIGDNCVIGANNLIFRSVPPGTVVKADTGRSEESING